MILPISAGLNYRGKVTLYIASPTAYSNEYVRGYPTDKDGLSYLYGIENAGLTPKYMYVVDSIGKLAEKGNSSAIKKILSGIVNSDGGTGELFCEYFEKTAFSHFKKIIHEISELNSSNRQKVYECFDLMTPKQNKIVRTYLQKGHYTGKESVVKKEVLGR